MDKDTYRYGWTQCLKAARAELDKIITDADTPKDKRKFMSKIVRPKLDCFDLPKKNGKCPVCSGKEPLVCPTCKQELRPKGVPHKPKARKHK